MYKFLLFLNLLFDSIVTAISKLSLQFQENKMSISQLQDKVNALSSMLESFKVSAGEHLNSFQQEVGDGNVYKGLDLTRSERNTHSALALARWLDSGERARRPSYND